MIDYVSLEKYAKEISILFVEDDLPLALGIEYTLKQEGFDVIHAKNLNMLLAKWTNPHKPIAISIGKKIIKTGVNRVPNPKPEKKVRIAVKKATIDMITISISFLFQVSSSIL